ncbi:hypothetical protein HJC23_001968 [Cyclotella cryptica]|uniref:Uncharacterized protein n=1 Tax=Cyclotella cryptica TaxID=29204 RepID=A0ABD3PT92_9STRA
MHQVIYSGLQAPYLMNFDEQDVASECNRGSSLCLRLWCRVLSNACTQLRLSANNDDLASKVSPYI